MADNSTVTLRVRPRWALLQIGVHQLLLLPLSAIGWLATGNELVVVACVMIVAVVAWIPMWRQPIVISDAGIRAVRSGYSLELGWNDLLSVTRRTFFGPFTVDAIETQPGSIRRRDGSPAADRLATKVRAAGHDRVLMIGTCVADAGSGPFGEMLRRHRPDLVPASVPSRR